MLDEEFQENEKPKDLSVRKEIRSLTDEELDEFFSALLEYKLTGRRDGYPYLKNYDELVALHAYTANYPSHRTCVDNNHGGAAFVIWHSLIVYEFESALRSINPNVIIPYWNWTIDSDLVHLSESVIFTEKYFGLPPAAEDMFVVNTSRLAYWPISQNTSELGLFWSSPSGFLRSADNYNPSPYLTRQTSSESYPPYIANYELCLDQTTYANFWMCVWGQYTVVGDKIHGPVHTDVGGQWYVSADDVTEVMALAPVSNTTGLLYCMGDLTDLQTSTNDPLFFLHHAFLDKLYYLWKQRTGDALATDDDPCGGFYGNNTFDSYPQKIGNNLDDLFVPPLYTFRSIDEIATLGGLTVSEACYYMQISRIPYQYE